MREEIVQYLENNLTDTEGFPLELYAGVPWSQYLQSMAMDGTHGDQITLQVAADLYNIRGTQREYSSKPLKHSIVKRVLVFKR